MIRKKQIQEINDKIDKLSDATLHKALEYDKLVDALKRVTVNVKKCYATFDENTMRYAVKIDYSVPQTVLYIGDDGQAEYNDRFKAMNDLRLIPVDELESVRQAIERAQKQNEGGNQ